MGDYSLCEWDCDRHLNYGSAPESEKELFYKIYTIYTEYLGSKKDQILLAILSYPISEDGLKINLSSERIKYLYSFITQCIDNNVELFGVL